MFVTSLQPIFGTMAQKPALAREVKQSKAVQPAIRPAVKKPKLFGRVSEVTIAALGLTMLAPLGAIAYAAGLPSLCLGVGAVAGLFGAAVLFAEKKAIGS